MQSLSVGIVLLNYNSKQFLKQFLPSIVKNSSNATIYLIDNASTDDSVEFIKQNYTSIKVIQLEKNYGYAGGYYHGLKNINEDLFVLLNTDVEVTENWLKPIVNQFESNANLGACQPKILDFNNKYNFEYAGASGGFIDYLGYPFSRGRIFDTLEEDNGQYNSTIPCFWASGCAIFLRKSAYIEAGELDYRLFAHQEEIDLCWRLQKKGFTVIAEPKSVVYHVGGGTLNYANPKKTYLNFRNNMLICIKNWSRFELFYKLPLRIILNYVAAFKELLSGNSKQAAAIIKATFVAQILFFKFRLNNFRVKQDATIKTIYAKSILLQYFYKDHKHYNQLE